MHDNAPVAGQKAEMADCAWLVPRSMPQTSGPWRAATCSREPPERGIEKNLDFDIGSSQIEPQRPERGQHGRVDSGQLGFVSDRRFEIGHMVERRIRPPPRRAPERRVVRAGRVALAVPRIAVQHFGEPVPWVRRPGPQRDESRVRNLARRRPQSGQHGLGFCVFPLCWFVGEGERGRQPVSPARITPDAADSAAGLSVFKAGGIRRVSDSKPARVPLNQSGDEGLDMLENDPRLGVR